MAREESPLGREGGALVIVTVFVAILFVLALVGVIYFAKKTFTKHEEKNLLAELIAPHVDADYYRRLEEEAKAGAEASALEQKNVTFFQKVAVIIGHLFLFQGYQASLTRKIGQAGMKWKASEYLTLQLGTTCLGFFLGIVTLRLWVAIITATLGFVVPLLSLWMKKRGRQKKFQAQLVDTLNLVANSLKAGYSFLQSVEMVAKESQPPTNEEYARVVRENSMGMPIDDALEALAARMESPDLDLTVTVVLITRQIGGNLAEILESIAATIRERLQLKGQIAALTAQGKMGGVVISALPFGLYGIMHMLNPEVMSLLYLEKPFGWAMIAVGVFMQTLGIIVILNMVNIEM